MSKLTDLIRSKYPGSYDDMDDESLESSVLSKYPEYKDLAGSSEPHDFTKEPPDALKATNDRPDIDRFLEETKRRYFQPDDQTTPPSNEPTNESGPISQPTEQPKQPQSNEYGLNKPLLEFPARWGHQAAEYLTTPHLDSPVDSRAAFGAGALEGLGNTISAYSTPLNAGLLATGLGEAGAAKLGLTQIARLMRLGTNALSAPVIYHGATKTFGHDSTLQERLEGIPEMAAGLIGSYPGEMPNLRPEYRSNGVRDVTPRTRGIAGLLEGETGSSPYGSPIEPPPTIDVTPNQRLLGGAAEGSIFDEGGSLIAPPQGSIPRPSGPWEGNLSNVADKASTGLTDDELFRLAQDKFNMGRPMPDSGRMQQQPFEEGLYPEGPPDESTALGGVQMRAYGKDMMPHTPAMLDMSAVDNYPSNIDVRPQGPNFAPRNKSPREVVDTDTGEVISDRNNNLGEDVSPSRRFFGDDIPEEPSSLISTKEREKLENLNQKIMKTGATPEETVEWRNLLNKQKEPPNIIRPFDTSSPNTITHVFDEGTKNAGEMLGTSLYEGKYPNTVTKELIQNSLTAIDHLGPNGKIHAHIDQDDNTIHVEDNGGGMTPQDIKKYYLVIGTSGTRGQAHSIGGFGFAKAGPLFGSDHMEFESTARQGNKTIQTTFKKEKGDAEVVLHTKQVPNSTPTGTRVKVKVPQEENVSSHQIRQYLENLAKESDFKGEISASTKRYGSYDAQDVLEKGNNAGKVIHTINADNADAEISIPHSETREERAVVHLILRNKGMYQTTQPVMFMSPVPNIPGKLIIDITSKVPEGKRDYPWTLNRENVRGSVADNLNQYVQDTLVNPARDHRKKEIQKLYDTMPSINIGNTKFYAFDAGGKFTPDEMDEMLTNPRMGKLAIAINMAIRNTLAELKQAYPTWSSSIEKTGFLFAKTPRGETFGINVPNPATGKHGILISPMAAFAQDISSNNASSLLAHLVLHEIAHEGARSEGAQFTFQLAKVYGVVGRVYENQLTSLLYDAIKDPRGGPDIHPEFQKLLQIYTESRGRADTVPDLLSGTASQSTDSRPNGKGQIPENATTDGGGTSGTINLKNPTPSDVRDAVAKGYKFVGVNPDGSFQMAGGGGGGKKPPTGRPILEGDIPDKPSRGGGKKADKKEVTNWDKAKDLMNFPRTVMASWDLSAPFRQGLGLIHRPEWWKSWNDMFRSFGSEVMYDAVQKSIADKPLFRQRPGPRGSVLPSFAEEAGLKLTDVHGGAAEREERFASRLAEMIPGVRASERAYTAFLNKLRADTFESLIMDGKVFGADGTHNMPLAREIAKYVNTATGRGSLGPLESSASTWNTVFFSPRLIASRLTMLNPMYYANANPFVRKQALKSLFAIAGAGLTIAELGKLAGGKVEMDYASSDFLKVKFKNGVRIDPFGGFQQYIVAAIRLMPQLTDKFGGRMKSTVTNREYHLGSGGFGRSNRFDVGERFVESKLNPIGTFVAGLMKGRDVTNQPFDIKEQVLQRLIPIFLQDIQQLITQDPRLFNLPHNVKMGHIHPENLPYALPSLVGMGMQQYDTH